MSRRLLVSCGGVAALLGVGAAWWRYGLLDPQNNALQRFWGFEGELVQGGRLAVKSLQGKPLLVNFWATWCPPCVEELPLIEAFFQENRSKNWQVLGIAADNLRNTTAFLGKNKLNFPTPLAGLEGIELSRTLGNASGALPFSVVINAKSEIVLRHMGKLSVEQLQGIAKLG